jgi:peroxiredoxin
MPLLQNGDMFPALTLDAVGGGQISLPGDLAGHYSVVLIYRGAWCPYCNAQLAAFSRAAARFEERGIKVAALSVDEEAVGVGLKEKHHLNFPIGYGADADQVVALTGAYTNPDPRYLQSTDFVLDPQGRLITVVYSSSAIGRLMPDDVLGFVDYHRKY